MTKDDELEKLLPEWLQKWRQDTAAKRAKRGLLYYTFQPQICVAHAEDALRIDRIYRAFDECKTWGDFRKAVPEEYELIMKWREEDDDDPRPRFKDTEPFDQYAIPGREECDYPRPWLQQEALGWLPVAAFRDCVIVTYSGVSGECVDIPRDKVPRLLEILKEEGYTVEHRTDLVFQ